MDYPSCINNKYTNKLMGKHSNFQDMEYYFFHNIRELYVGFDVMNYAEYLEINDALFEYPNQNK